MKSLDFVQKVTSELSAELIEEQLKIKTQLEYHPMPHATTPPDGPNWKVRLTPTTMPGAPEGIELNGELTLGRSHDLPDVLSLHDGEQLGVSRQHAMLRPTNHELFIIDLGSTNGTWINGYSIGVNIPYALNSGDQIRLGRLDMTIQMENHSPSSRDKTLTDPTLFVASRIVSQLSKHKILDSAVDVLKLLIDPECVAIWLLDEHTHDLDLEKTSDDNAAAATLRLTDNDECAVKSLQNNQVITVQSNQVYVPLTIASVPIGVIGAMRQNHLNTKDIDQIRYVAHFLAIALQNARLYETIKNTLDSWSKMTTNLNYVLQNEVRQHIRHVEGYARMLSASDNLDLDNANAAQQVWEATTDVLEIIDQLVDVTNMLQEPAGDHVHCDLVNIIYKVVDDLAKLASNNQVSVGLKLISDPYLIHADGPRLYQSLYHLVSYAIKQAKQHVSVALVFWENDILIRVVADEIDEEQKHGRIYFGQKGLALSMVRAVVEAHRGRLHIREQEDGAGTEFVIKLPGTLRVR